MPDDALRTSVMGMLLKNKQPQEEIEESKTSMPMNPNYGKHLEITADQISEYKKEESDDLLEQLSALEHEQWAHWTKYMLESLTADNIARWKEQIETSYENLSDKEKESDREWARKVLKITGKSGKNIATHERTNSVDLLNQVIKTQIKLAEVKEPTRTAVEVEEDIRTSLSRNLHKGECRDIMESMFNQ